MQLTETAMLQLLTFVCAFTAAAHAQACDVCVAGRCQVSKTIMRGFEVTNQMAIDRAGKVLYVQLESDLNVAYDFNDLVVERVQKLNTSGLAVDQNAHVLYTGDHTKTLYAYQREGATGIDPTANLQEEADLMFFKDKLYYTMKCCRGLYYIDNYNKLTLSVAYQLAEYTITDFVVNKNDKIYFVSDDIVHVYNNRNWEQAIDVVARKKYVLSVDKFGDVYLGYPAVNVIYKLDDSDRLVEYGVYASGSVSRFVFDDSNNIVFHDSASGSVAYWTPGGAECGVEHPRSKYVIRTKRTDDDICFTPMPTI